MNVLVLPTNRPERAEEFLEAWRPWPWDRIIVVEDGPDVTASHAGGRDAERVVRYCWRDIDAMLERPEIISRKDSAIRAFGFWKAWQLGADYIFTLDDDCFPVSPDYVEQHIRNLEATPRWGTTVRPLRVRGVPYDNVGTLARVYVSLGLWVGHPDIDAIQSLAHPPRRLDTVVDRGLSSWVLPSEQYFPMCGMNLAFRREAACLMYFPPMGQGSPYARFDDIWAGLVLQRICRHLRLSIVCGHPVVEHRRASDPFANLVKEAPGIRANESIWEMVDAVPLAGSDPLACMREMGAALRDQPAGDDYVRRWGAAILEWCRLFDAPSLATPFATMGEREHA